MAGRYKPYPEYKNSGVEWLDSIPNHWAVKKLKFLAYVQPSNVDKKTSENEIPVLLCNYTDVYYNETVHAGMEFMKASATEDQIAKFALKSGDIIITKDSEDPNDIAIPTFVPESMPGVVCGYHLSIIRPNSIAYGLYIKRVFECGYARAYFATRSNGLTRYGLGTYALDNVFYPKPPEKEAKNIANFLDHETAKIDTLIEKQIQLIQMLKEKRQAVISRAATKGLNPNAKMRDSGIEWLGEIPEHWELPKLIYRTSAIGDGLHSTPKYQDGTGYYFVNGNNLVDGQISVGLTAKEVPEEEYKKHSLPLDENTVLLSINGTIGNIARYDGEKVILGKSAAYINCANGLLPEYLMFYLQSSALQRYFELEVTGTTIFNLSLSSIRKIKACIPPTNEQKEIAGYCANQKRVYGALITKANLAINLMQERRSALISVAVTGKIDIRDWVAPQPRQTHKEVAV